MNNDIWLTAPEEAYAQWQRAEATGADRRAFAEQSIVRHRSMFSRFNDYLVSHRQTVATFGAHYIEGFFTQLARDCLPGRATRLRYLKLIDRFARHLVALELRKDNPASEMLLRETWSEDEPTPTYLSRADDERLQAVCGIREFVSFKDLRNTSIVAPFLGSGVTAAELRQLGIGDLGVAGERSTVYVEKHGPPIARRVPIDAFAIEVLRTYHDGRQDLHYPRSLLFVATAGGKPMKADTLLKCVSGALREAVASAADESPRLLCKRLWPPPHQLWQDQRTGLGLSSHRTATRLQQTLGADKARDNSTINE